MNIKVNRLLVINYCMDLEHPVLSHQVQAVNALSTEFDQVIVLTGRLGICEVSPNVKVISTNWIAKQPIRNSVKFLSAAIPIVITKKFNSIFSHMTEVQSALIAPLTRILGVRHYLWYAHTTRSRYLVWCHFWLTGIITSTAGSCPLSGSRIHPIGQAINTADFAIKKYKPKSLLNFIHIGRFDPSKNIENIIQAVESCRELGENLCLTLVGSPSNKIAEINAREITTKYDYAINEGWLKFVDAIPRSHVAKYLQDFDVFIHSYVGSLDKTIVEATMLGVPVVTVNPEYRLVFGGWSSNTNPTLLDEIRGLFSSSRTDVATKLQQRQLLSIKNHSLNNWTVELSRILH
jgi:glycosyltransferase involved in cell wall biosynthesis